MNGEESAWKKIAEVWGRTLLQYCRRRELQQSDAEEVAQNVLVKMYGAISKGNFEHDGEQKKLKHWVYAIAENEIRSFYSRFHNKPKSPGGSIHQEILANLGSEEDSGEFESILVSQILEVIRGDFEASTWEAFDLHHIQCVSTPEIAKKMGIKPGTVRQKIYRVMQRLKQELETVLKPENSV